MILNIILLLLILIGASSLHMDVGYSFFGIQHYLVYGCSAASFNFGVLTEEGEHTSFSSAIFSSVQSLSGVDRKSVV